MRRSIIGRTAAIPFSKSVSTASVSVIVHHHRSRLEVGEGVAGDYFFSSQAFQKKKNGTERKSPRNSLRTTDSPNRSPNLIRPTSS